MLFSCASKCTPIAPIRTLSKTIGAPTAGNTPAAAPVESPIKIDKAARLRIAATPQNSFPLLEYSITSDK